MKSLKNKFRLHFVLSALLPILVFAVYTIWTNAEKMEKDVVQNIQTLAHPDKTRRFKSSFGNDSQCFEIFIATV